MILTLYRRSTQLFFHAYDIVKSTNSVLAIPNSVLEQHLDLCISMPLSTLFLMLAPRLQLCLSDDIRLSIKPATFRQGQRVCQRVLFLQSVYLPKRLLAHSLRFIVEAYLTTGIITIQVYNPSDCFVWRTSLPWHDKSSVEEYMKSLYVVPFKSNYSLETKANVNMIVQTHVSIVIQRHYRRRKSLRFMIELAKTQWLRIQVRNQYNYVHKHSGQWKATKPNLLSVFPHTTPYNGMFEYIFVNNYSNGGNILGSYYIYPRKGRIARISMEVAATKVQMWFRNKCHNFDIMTCLRALKQTYSYHSRRSSMVFVPVDISLLHIALAGEARMNAALMYEYATRIFLYCRESDEATALVVCCACVFWLATETQKSHRRQALILLKRYQPKITLHQVYSIEYLFYQAAYLHQPNNMLIVQSYALFLDILCYKPQRAIDLYIKALNQMTPTANPLQLNFARFRLQYPEIAHVALQWTAKPTEVDPKYIPVFNGFALTPEHEKAAHCIQSWYKKRSENYLIMPGLTQAVLALETNHFAVVRYRLDKFRPGNGMMYALHIHILIHEHDEAKAMYKRLHATDPVHPFIVCGQVILCLTMLQVNAILLQRIRELQRLAKTQDFSLLEIRYFRFAAVTQPTNPLALTNYALYHQIILGKHGIAEKLLLKAIKLSKNGDLYYKIMEQFQRHRLYKGISCGRGPSWAIYCSRQTRAVKMINGWFRMEHHLKRLPGQSRHRQMHFWYYDVTRELVWDTTVMEEKCLKQTTDDTTQLILATIEYERQLHSAITIQSCYRHWSQTRHFVCFKSLFSLPRPSVVSLNNALDLHLYKGVWHEAQKIYCHEMYLDHKNAIAVGGLAMTLNAQGHWAKATKWFKYYRSLSKPSEAAASLTREPTLWWRWLNYIIALQGLITRFDLAELLYRKSIAAFRTPQLEIMLEGSEASFKELHHLSTFKRIPL
ncbi:hypothetical protein THRCLA_05689 [Thraustotheca clavata]|uniref:Uncharacterized protein n=1 Tax=Thraustotheca clavata TaxID=74557 RepID=A0A1V9ZV43_9STRA|nr:hypothetical protein THRCLA_05689 [Thraustotheca clavata]